MNRAKIARMISQRNVQHPLHAINGNHRPNDSATAQPLSKNGRPIHDARTIYKLRAKLPGANIGVHSTTKPFTAGVNLNLFDCMVGTKEERIQLIQDVSLVDES